ncbi:hypothetical protein [Reichenbachiella sp. MSK19-1]|uniref:hypothetical protein n=1 Tax=Reichenbachiella sp. MSK19-1 TaxID=1897631 RepID=UPI0011C49A15|nr:hypothetical protein [Reichenbachiella sp. MSK19-1]
MINYWRQYLFVFVSLAMVGCMEEDPNSVPPSQTYVKYFGSTATEQMVDMVQTVDNEFLMLGYTNNKEAGDFDFYIIKTDSAGNGIWQQTYGYNHGNTFRSASQDVPKSVRLINNDQNLLAIGTSDVSDTLSILMFNIDVASGEVVDSLRYQYYDNRTGTNITDRGYVSTLGADVLYNESSNEYIILGSVETWSNNIYTSDPQSILLMAIDAGADWQDPNLSPSWMDIGGLRLEDTGIKLMETDGDYFLLSTVTIPFGSNLGYGNEDVLLAEFNPSSGAYINSTLYGTTENDIAANFISYGNSLMVVGTTGDDQNEKAFYLKVPKALPESDSEGFAIDVVGNESLGLNASGTQGKDLIRLPNGNIYIAGQLNAYTSPSGEFKENEIVIFRTDGFGNLDTDNFRIYGSEDNDQANAILLQEDGALVIGATIDFGSTSMMSLMKTNVRGEFK